MTIYVTPYDLQTKKCLAASVDCQIATLAEAKQIHAPCSTRRIISDSRHLLLLDCNGSGLAFSDFRFREES